MNYTLLDEGYRTISKCYGLDIPDVEKQLGKWGIVVSDEIDGAVKALSSSTENKENEIRSYPSVISQYVQTNGYSDTERKKILTVISHVLACRWKQYSNRLAISGDFADLMILIRDHFQSEDCFYALFEMDLKYWREQRPDIGDMATIQLQTLKHHKNEKIISECRQNDSEKN